MNGSQVSRLAEQEFKYLDSKMLLSEQSSVLILFQGKNIGVEEWT